MKRHRTKAAWAAAKAAELRDQVAHVAAQRVPAGNWRHVRTKMARIDQLGREAVRFEGLASRYHEQGL
jgi:hypothetical protein